MTIRGWGDQPVVVSRARFDEGVIEMLQLLLHIEPLC